MISLADIVGQDRAVEQVARALSGTRMPHAYMFCGPKGVGRRTTAEALAAVLLCRRPQPEGPKGIPAPCHTCDSCLALAGGMHPDYHWIHRELAQHSSDSDVRNRKMQKLPIEVIREFVVEAAGSGASKGRGRVFVIREAELMSDAAQNALLKTLEEPPPDVTLILLCRSDAELLPTTRSRCSIARFGPLPWSFVTERLVAAEVAPPEARFWAAYTDGSLGESLRLAESGLYAFKCDLVDRLADMAESFDPDLAEAMVAKAEAMAHATVAENKQLAMTVANRTAGEVLLGLLASVYRDAMRLAAGVAGRRIHADQPAQIDRIAAAMGERAADIVDQMARYQHLLWRNLNAKVLWDNVMITCATAAPLGV